jgi:hypothetical protein
LNGYEIWQRALAARQRTGPGITFLDRNQRAFADDEAMLIAGVDGDAEQVAGVNNDKDYDYDYEQPGYDMDVNPYNEPDAAEAPEPDAAEAPEAAEAPHHHEHDAAEAPELDALEAPHYHELDAAEAPHDDLDAAAVEAPFEQPMDDAEALVPEAAQYEPDDAAQLELDAAMNAEYNVRTREGMRPRRRPTYGHLNTTRGASPMGQAEGDLIGSRASTGNRGSIIVETVVEDSTDGGGRGDTDFDAEFEHAETPQNNDGGFTMAKLMRPPTLLRLQRSGLSSRKCL